MISILLAAYNSGELLQKVFLPGFVQNSSNMEDVELIIYDNGNPGEAWNYICNNLESLNYDNLVNNVKIIGNGKNIGLNAALNECAKVAKGDWFYLPHTDMYLLPGWDTALLEATKNQKPDTMLLCSRSIEPTKGHTDYHIIKNYGKEWNEFKEEKLLEDFDDYSDKSIVSGYRMPFFIHKTLWNRMDGVDSKYFSYCTDDDLVQTVYDIGIRRFWMVNGSLVYHLQGKSNQQQTVDRDSNKPYEYFIDKWKKKGYSNAKHPGQWHSELIPWYQRIK